jgi:stage IV sporulation protein FB
MDFAKWTKPVTIIILAVFCVYSDEFLYFSIFLAIHEGAHFICGKILGYSYRQLHIMPFGLSITFKDEFIRPFDDIIISITGPLINFVFFVVFLFLYNKGYDTCYVLKNINLALCVFNLIPVSFLDGGRILKNILAYNKSFFLGHFLTSLNGIIFGSIIVITSFRQISLNTILALVLGAFFIYKSYVDFRETKILVIKDTLYKQNYIYQKKNLGILHKAFSKDTKLVDIIKIFCFNKYYVIHLFEDGKLTDKVNESDIVKLYCTYGNITIKECINYINT